MVVHEKRPACQVEVEILLENARKQNTCPECGHTFFPRHAINTAGFGATKPSTESGKGAESFAGVLVVLGVVAGLFVSWLVGFYIIITAAIVVVLKQIVAKKS